MMSKVEDSEENDSECDLHQDRPTQGTLTGGRPIRQTRAKTYSHGSRKGER